MECPHFIDQDEGSIHCAFNTWYLLNSEQSISTEPQIHSSLTYNVLEKYKKNCFH